MMLRDHSFRIFYGPADDPLDNFYIPALSASVRYDRSAGFFSSTALAVAASGVARLIQNGGRIRLLVGASLDENDVTAIQQGHALQARVTERLLQHFPDPQDALLRARLEVMAWMIAEGMLEVKVVLPRDERGLPIPAARAQDYYHPKSGIFTDANGDRLAFSGSVNESETAWTKNYETFSVYFSWDATQPYLAQVATNFERPWNGQEKDWIALDIPRAVRDSLLTYRPANAPTRDPLERGEQLEPVRDEPKAYGAIPQSERLQFAFVRDAPYLPHATGLGSATSAITPLPHQARVANEILRRFPDRAMLCDEVGLGKTIEAGLVIRQLVLSGRVKRLLILAPKSILKQWQEELYEKFALDIPRYDSGKFWGVYDKPLNAPDGNPWDAFDCLIAGSQLAKRADRRQQILAAHGWDLLVVDEAHHARRKDFKERIYRPNRLLGLLNDINERNKAASLLLMNATPMQIHPLEVWDLLTVLGLGGHWGTDEDNFLRFFGEMRKPFDQADWEFVFDLVQDYLATGGTIDADFQRQVIADIGQVKWATIEGLLTKPGERARILRQLGHSVQPHVKELAHRHTPIARFVFRNTRTLLREYLRRGIMRERVPTRQPRIERVEMLPEEQALYTRIDEYISHFYQQYENERRGLGFVMTVYRRRLTSSFHALHLSLERRLKFLRGVISGDKIFDDDDLEQDELEQDVAEELLTDADRERFQSEVEYVEDFIQQLRLLGIAESKLEALKDELRRVMRQRSTVLVFTQYTDTMDYLRDQLKEVYGSQVACYSGRGGEVWNGIAWVSAPKEKVKNDFRAGRISILLCTESASEGLNLQTCGVMINYDMPWNPMRVEQRIGRIDRIGQQFDQVWITNYFYRDTIEDAIYQRLADRIDWFEVVVGDLQPILAEVGEVTRRLAMLPPTEREAQLERAITELRARLDNRAVESLNLDEFAKVKEDARAAASPVSLGDLEMLFTTSQTTAHLFQRHPDISDAYLLNWSGETLPVTFSAKCFDAHPETVRFLSYGSPLLIELLQSILAPEPDPNGDVLRFQSDRDFELRGWYGGATSGAIETLGDLRARIHAPTNAAVDAARARDLFVSETKRLRDAQQDIVQQRHRAAHLAERVKAQRLLIKAALVEIALGQQRTLFDADVYPASFSEQAVKGLQRHGAPWRTLVHLAFEGGLHPEADDAFYLQIKSDSRESLQARFAQLTNEARQTAQRLNTASRGLQEEETRQAEIQIEIYRK